MRWTIKKAECQIIDASELWCWRILLRVPWTSGRSKQSILKEISPGCLLEGLMLKLKLQYFGHLIRRVDSLEKTLMLGIETLLGRGGEGERAGEGLSWEEVLAAGRGMEGERASEPGARGEVSVRDRRAPTEELQAVCCCWGCCCLVA